MNKFADPEEDDFLEVKDVIEDMVKRAPDLVQKVRRSMWMYLLYCSWLSDEWRRYQFSTKRKRQC